MKGSRSFTKILSGVVLASVCLTATPVWNVQAGVKGKCFYSEQIDKGVVEYGKKVAPDLLANVVGSEELYDVTIGDYDKLYLGKPFTVLDGEGEEKVYYFPVMEGEEVKLIITVSKTDGTWDASLGKGFSDELNALDKKEYLLYEDEDGMYAKSEKGTEKIVKYEGYDKESRYTLPRLLGSVNMGKQADWWYVHKTKLQKVSLKEKVEKAEHVGRQALTAYGNSERQSLAFQEPSMFNDPFLVNKANEKTLNMVGCLVNQRDSNDKKRDMCWAACVASIMRYKTGTKLLTAQQVCKRMDVPMKKGGDIKVVKSTLAKYGQSYSIKNNYLTWNQIKTNIKNKKPAVIGAQTGYYFFESENKCHMVTLYGYAEGTKNKTYTFWNSSLERVESKVYTEEIVAGYPTFKWAKRTFYWYQSLY